MSLFTYFLEYNRYLNVVGIFVILAIAWLFSQKRAHINYRLVFSALLLQFLIGVAVLKTTIGSFFVEQLAFYIGKLYFFADTGAAFMFGALADINGPWGFVFAFKLLPMIIFFGAFMGLLFHFTIIQRVITVINKIIQPILGTSGAETLCAVSNSFLGQTEAPLLIRNYLKDMTKSEMLVVMVSGMATISGGILVVYAAMGVSASHLLASSVMAIPASIMIAKILYPETEKNAHDAQQISVELPVTSHNVFDAISTGTSDGLQLALNVGAMLIAFLGLLALINGILEFSSCQLNNAIAGFNQLLSTYGASWSIKAYCPPLNLEFIFSILFAPFGYLLGFVGSEARSVGALIGTKIAVNELIAYSNLVNMHLSDRATMLVTYALCGFSNFSCIGIQIGGIGALVPEKRAWLTELGLYAVLGGALSNLLSAMIAGILL